MKGKREDVRRSLDKTEGREMSITEFEQEKKEGVEEEGGQARGKRSRALSCRPGSQIRRGLKSGVDCV